jgi:hypothetical protein
MKIIHKIIVILGLATGSGLLIGGGIEEAKAETYYNQYNVLYSLDWNRLYSIWENPRSSLRLSFPTLSGFKDAFDISFNHDYGYLLSKAAPYQNIAIILFICGSVAIAISLFFFYRFRKQSKVTESPAESNSEPPAESNSEPPDSE